MSIENKERRQKIPTRVLLVRILALFLAFLMVGGTLFSIIVYLLPYNVSAVEPKEGDPLISAGIQYGEDVTTGYTVSSTYGFTLGLTVINEGSKSFTPLFDTSVTTVSAVVDKNLIRYGTDYSVASDTTGIYIGVYHIEAGGRVSTYAECESLLSTVRSYISGTNYYAFPAYINGTFRVYVSDFSTREKAETAMGNLSSLTSALSCRIVGEGAKSVALTDSYNDRIIFEYEDSTTSYMGIEAICPQYETQYIRTPDSRLYPGVLSFKRSGDIPDGIAVTNVVNVETYVTGVLPWEIGNSWNSEVQRAFAIAARTFVYNNLGRHFSSYGFDVCNGQHCQAYLGCSRTNDNVIGATVASKGMVVSYEGVLCALFYSAVSGGETVTPGGAWGGSDAPYPYIQSIKTPWEQYTDHSEGVWTAEVSPTELASYLYSKGYYNLTGSYISSITINSTHKDTGYIDSITYTDNLGNSQTVTTTDGVRSSLSKYVNSSNFVIGRGSIEYSYEVVTDLTCVVAGIVTGPTGPAFPDLFDSLSLGSVNAVTDEGNKNGAQDSLVAITGYGRRAITSENVSVLTADGYKKLLDLIASGNAPKPENPGGNIVLDNTGNLTSKDLAINAKTKTITETYTAAGGSDYFVFAGKGWGHGVGISQFGANDLGNAGVPAELILKTYMPGTTISHISEIGR